VPIIAVRNIASHGNPSHQIWRSIIVNP